MNCSPTICIALLLLSLSAGMWLLYKTQKENLGTFFKVIAWFVIVVSICSMICCGLRCLMHGCMRGGHCGSMQVCGMEYGGFNKRVMIFKGDGGECRMENTGCCHAGKEGCDEEDEECMKGKTDCCKKEGDKCESEKVIKIDSAAVKSH